MAHTLSGSMKDARPGGVSGLLMGMLSHSWLRLMWPESLEPLGRALFLPGMGAISVVMDLDDPSVFGLPRGLSV